MYLRDNVPKHTAKVTKKCFSDNSLDVLELPSVSPDFNPIKHLWADVKRAVSLKNITNTTLLFDEVVI